MVETKKKIKTKKYTKKHCAPSSSPYKFSCFNKKSLLKIARSWNKSNPKNKIKINGKTVKDIWSQIDNKLKKKCNEEICWTQQDFVKKLKDSEIKKILNLRNLIHGIQTNLNGYLLQILKML